MDTCYILVLAVIVITVEHLKTQETCSEIIRRDQIRPEYYCSNYDYCYLSYSTYWYKSNFWGGYMEIPWKESSILRCSKYYKKKDFLVLTKEPFLRRGNTDETVSSVEGCIRNQNDTCKEKVNIDVKMCFGNIYYRFSWLRARIIYVCLDFVFTGDCNDSIVKPAATMVGENTVVLLNGTGWYSTFQDGRHHLFPSLEYTETVFKACPEIVIHYLLQHPVPMSIDQTPLKLTICSVSRVIHDTVTYYRTDCKYIMYMRKCNGTLQFETTWTLNRTIQICLVKSVRVEPEIKHTTQLVDSDGNMVKKYNPVLKYRCSFKMDTAAEYKIKWYINDNLFNETGPSNSSEDLALQGDAINEMELGYMVKCGVLKMTTPEPVDSFSFNFFAGWKISDHAVYIIKGNFAIVDVELTIPIGCAYTDDKQANCSEQLSTEDASYIPGICKGGIVAVNADDMRKTYHEVEKLKRNEEWNGNRKYRFKLSTIDVNYDDATVFDLQVRITDPVGNLSREYIEKHSKIYVTEARRHVNKICYSHVDPHMRTADGKYYEQQREGDYMLLRNIAHQMEVQESARYCFPPRHRTRPPPVCACGIAIRFGADVFMIDRCSGFNFLDFVQCGNGGILDVVRVHDYHYRVRTPTGTVIDITLHNWWKTMNIDVYMSPRDFGNIDGLCGYFDGNAGNDFLHRDGKYSNGNTDHKFSDSWRLSNEENLFKNCNRVLKPRNNNSDGRICIGTNSITKLKCKPDEQVKCGKNIVKRGLWNPMPLSPNPKAIMTEEEVTTFCNASIFESPAVLEMSDKLGDEDLQQVVGQCIYDVTVGNDTVWADAHVQALSNIVTTMLELNPVYTANNIELVKTFLSKTCLNNCSGNGACSDSGYCSCIEPYRGPDCSIDVRVPPIINVIEGAGVCSYVISSDCRCFVIRTDNIFDGFMCNSVTYMVFFNGTRSQVGRVNQPGEYEDIFTGVCCVSGEQVVTSDNITDPFVVMYELSVSNDGVNYGETIPIYVYDPTCMHEVIKNNKTVVEIKAGNCFIDNTCFKQGTVEEGDHCSVCDPVREQFKWLTGNCEEDGNDLISATVILIIVGSIIGLGIFTLATVLIAKKRRKRTRV